MALSLTKVAYGALSLEEITGWFSARGPVARLTTRYLPKRHAEIVTGAADPGGNGSLFWIFKHQLVARTEILGFEDAPDGRTHILIDPRVRLVRPVPRRAHQGWRYLAEADAPRDLVDGEEVGEVLPPRVAGELARLGLV
ncbi:DUF1489 family protein [Parablastomonas sp. CN1-191]|uniref:DUF1489 family protein n=1 Tax=Parablastomonas sp. CN1-191 TaxID=3400908 RepID=UPI003BF837EF